MLSTHFSIINCRLYKWLQKEKKKEQGVETRALDKLGSIYTWENIATAYSQEVAARSSENLKSWKFKLLCKISWLLGVGNLIRVNINSSYISQAKSLQAKFNKDYNPRNFPSSIFRLSTQLPALFDL